MAIVKGTGNGETINAADGVTEGMDVIYGYGGIDRSTVLAATTPSRVEAARTNCMAAPATTPRATATAIRVSMSACWLAQAQVEPPRATRSSASRTSPARITTIRCRATATTTCSPAEAATTSSRVPAATIRCGVARQRLHQQRWRRRQDRWRLGHRWRELLHRRYRHQRQPGDGLYGEGLYVPLPKHRGQAKWIENVENVYGSNHNDRIWGDDEANVLGAGMVPTRSGVAMAMIRSSAAPVATRCTARTVPTPELRRIVRRRHRQHDASALLSVATVRAIPSTASRTSEGRITPISSRATAMPT